MAPRKMTAFKDTVSAKPRKESNSSMNDLLECPVCMTFMDPPIHQCSNGHTICSKCKTKVNNVCPMCREELGNIRCLALEKVAERLEFPCKFHLFGCKEIFSYNKRVEHEGICSFSPYNCPYDEIECSITGDIKFLVAHLKHTHSVESIDIVNGSTFDHFCKISDCDDKKWKPAIFNCLGHQFYLHFEAFTIKNAPVFMSFLRFMGNKDEAHKFRYSIEVGGNVRKMTWQGVPRSIRENNETIRDSYDGLIVQKRIALFFSGGKGPEQKLKVRVRIWRV